MEEDACMAEDLVRSEIQTESIPRWPHQIRGNHLSL